MHQFGFKKKKNQVKSPSPESRVPETGPDPSIGSDRDSGPDICTLFYLDVPVLYFLSRGMG